MDRNRVEAIRSMQGHLALELGWLDRRERVLRAILANLDAYLRLAPDRRPVGQPDPSPGMS